MTASWSGVRRLWDRRREPDKILGQEHVRDIKHKPKSNGSCRHKHKTRCDAGKSLAPSRVPYLYPHSIILDHSADVFSYLSLVVGGEGVGGWGWGWCRRRPILLAPGISIANVPSSRLSRFSSIFLFFLLFSLSSFFLFLFSILIYCILCIYFRATVCSECIVA